MCDDVAPNHVGEPLIQVISENQNDPGTSPALISPPTPSPPLESENLMDGSERPPEMPDALSRLQRSGHHLQVVGCDAWNVRGNRVKIRKELSICFSVDTIISSNDIICGFDKAGIDIDGITSIQRRASNNSWVVTFDSKAIKDAALNEHSITIAGCSVFLGDCENVVSIVKIYELPAELPDTVVIGRLAHYGRVISFRRDRVADTILNGVRTARMLIDRPIPSQTFIAGEYVRFWYPSQPKTCRKCGAEDHLAAACNSQRCFNCERPGHRVEQCDMPALCRVCLSDAHETASCPFIFYGANVSSPKPGNQTYSEAAKTGSVAETARQTETNKARLREEERVRREAHARQEQEQKEKKKKEKERSDREEKERQERKKKSDKSKRDHERERDRDRRHHDRRRSDGDDRSEDERSTRDRYCSARDRSSHRHRDHSESRSDSDSDSESDGWTTVSYRRRKHKSKSY